MMQRSWAENPNQSLLYSEDFLRSAFEYPGSSFSLAPAIYENASLLGFVAGFPRSVRWHSRPLRLVLNSFLTVSIDAKGRGLGLQIWGDLIDRSRHEGYDGTINFCVDGDEMNRMMPALARLLRLDTQCIFTVKFLTRFLRAAPPRSDTHVSDADIDLFMELASRLPSELPLARLWTRAEAEWQCRGRAGAITVTSCCGGRRGMLTGYLTQVASTPPQTVVLIEDLFWGDLRAGERAELLDNFLSAAAARGARVASCPLLGYSALDTLAAARFRPSKRVLHTYLTLWNGHRPSAIPGLYMDIF